MHKASNHNKQYTKWAETREKYCLDKETALTHPYTAEQDFSAWTTMILPFHYCWPGKRCHLEQTFGFFF